MGWGAQVWASLSDSERADIALETAHLPRAYQLLKALDRDLADEVNEVEHGIVERDWNMQPNPNARPLSLAVGRIAAYCGRVERPHGGHVWNTSGRRWCPGDEVPGRPEPRLTDSGSYSSEVRDA